MKLKTKLLPLVGIAATAAVVAPLVTSCNKGLEMLDITKGYTPSTKSSVAGELTQQEATKTYMDDVEKNPEIFKEDFINGVYNNVIKNKNRFLNLPTAYSSYVKVATFKLNSLKVGVSNPTFGTTDIAYPGEPKVTYPTVSFEYSIQIDYKYEYIGYCQSSSPAKGPGLVLREESGYHARTIQMETNIKYTNVPFLAIAHRDETGLKTYWQVSPIDTIIINSKESGIDTTNYYNQLYMFEYMSDDWSIGINASANVEDKFVDEDGAETQNSTQSYNSTISDYDTLEDLAYSEKTSGAYDFVSYTNMMTTFANFGFESWYLQSVAQKPEIQTNGFMQGYGTIPTTTTKTNQSVGFGAFYMPQTLVSGTKVTLYSTYDSETKTGTPIQLNSMDTDTPMTLSLVDADEKPITITQDPDSSTQYGINNARITLADSVTTNPEAGTYYFALPKTIIAVFEYKNASGETVTDPQTVYMNQSSLPIELN